MLARREHRLLRDDEEERRVRGERHQDRRLAAAGGRAELHRAFASRSRWPTRIRRPCIVVKRDNSPELLTKADGLFKAGKNAEARAEYLTVLAAHPELTAINRAIAFTYGREKNHPEALKYLDLALAANPNDATLLQLAAASAMEVSDYPRAMGYLGRIDEAALTDPELMVNAAMNLLNRRRSAEAATLLTRVIARFPASPTPTSIAATPACRPASRPRRSRISSNT